MNQLPMYAGMEYVNDGDVSRDVHARALSIPCSTNLSERDQDRVIAEIQRYFDGAGATGAARAGRAAPQVS